MNPRQFAVSRKSGNFVEFKMSGVKCKCVKCGME